MDSHVSDLCVRNARVVTERGMIKGGVAVTDGTITAVGSTPSLPAAETEIDADGNYLFPGFIDGHVHWGISDYEHEYHTQLEHDFETETRGAVFGGVTTVIPFLLQSDPYLPDMEFFKSVGEENSYTDFGYHAIIHQDHHYDEIEGLIDAGVRSFKLFFDRYKHAAPELGIGHADAGQAYEVLDAVADVPDAVVMFHAENGDIATRRADALQEAGRNDLQAWEEAAPPVAEAMQIEQICQLTEFTDSSAYIVHISTAEGVEICREYQSAGVDINVETLVAHLCHTYDEDLGVWGKISPPLRDSQNQQDLWEGLRSGAIQHVGTDHCPHKRAYKEKDQGKYGDMWDAIPGDNNGAEYFLPAMVSAAVNDNRLSIERVVETCATNNAKQWGLYPQKGVIAEGADADLVIVDPDRSTVIDDDFYHTMEPGYSTFHGDEVTGLPTHTIVGGEVVVEEGDLVGSPGGRTFLAV
jgi:dihydropyrimidinase